MTDAPPPAPAPPPQHPAVEHEDRDINVRAVLGFGAALFVVAVVVHVILAFFFASLLHWEQREKKSQFPLAAGEQGRMPQTTFGSPVAGQLPESPRLEGLNLAEPQHDVGRERKAGTAAQKNADEEEELKGRGKPGAERIPIDEAMRLVAEERKPQGREPAPPRYDAGIPGTGGGSNSGRDIPEGKR